MRGAAFSQPPRKQGEQTLGQVTGAKKPLSVNEVTLQTQPLTRAPKVHTERRAMQVVGFPEEVGTIETLQTFFSRVVPDPTFAALNITVQIPINDKLVARYSVREAGAPWLADSGANVVVIPSASDPAFIEWAGQARTLGTAAGPASARPARIRTPFGVVIGLVSEGSPRIIPWAMVLVCGYHIDYRDTRFAKLYKSDTGHEVRTLWTRSGCPMLPDNLGLNSQQTKIVSDANNGSPSLFNSDLSLKASEDASDLPGESQGPNDSVTPGPPSVAGNARLVLSKQKRRKRAKLKAQEVPRRTKQPKHHGVENSGSTGTDSDISDSGSSESHSRDVTQGSDSSDYEDIFESSGSERESISESDIASDIRSKGSDICEELFPSDAPGERESLALTVISSIGHCPEAVAVEAGYSSLLHDLAERGGFVPLIGLVMISSSRPGRVLLGKRHGPVNDRYYGTPGGGFLPGETPIQAAMRYFSTFAQEKHLVTPIRSFATVEASPFVVEYFLCDMSLDFDTPDLSPKMSAMDWHPWGMIPHPALPTLASLVSKQLRPTSDWPPMKLVHPVKASVATASSAGRRSRRKRVVLLVTSEDRGGCIASRKRAVGNSRGYWELPTTVAADESDAAERTAVKELLSAEVGPKGNFAKPVRIGTLRVRNMDCVYYAVAMSPVEASALDPRLEEAGWLHHQPHSSSINAQWCWLRWTNLPADTMPSMAAVVGTSISPHPLWISANVSHSRPSLPPLSILKPKKRNQAARRRTRALHRGRARIVAISKGHVLIIRGGSDERVCGAFMQSVPRVQMPEFRVNRRRSWRVKLRRSEHEVHSAQAEHEDAAKATPAYMGDPQGVREADQQDVYHDPANVEESAEADSNNSGSERTEPEVDPADEHAHEEWLYPFVLTYSPNEHAYRLPDGTMFDHSDTACPTAAGTTYHLMPMCNAFGIGTCRHCRQSCRLDPSPRPDGLLVPKRRPRAKRRNPRRPEDGAACSLAPDPHLLCHFPPDPVNCKACREAKQIAADRWERGTSTLEPDEGRVMILVDYQGKIAPRSSKGNVWGLIFRLVRGSADKVDPHGYNRRDPFYIEGCKSRDDANFVDALHAARVEWGVDTLPFILKGDMEGAFKSVFTRRYMAMNDGFVRFGVPRRNDTVAAVEAAVRVASEGLRTALHASSLPLELWDHAWTTFAVNYNRVMCGYSPRQNTVVARHVIPFGWLGHATLPAETYKVDKTGPRGTPIIFLSYALNTPGGISVAFFDEHKGMLRKTIILERDVIWTDGMAMTSEFVGLRKRRVFQDCLDLRGADNLAQPPGKDRRTDQQKRDARDKRQRFKRMSDSLYRTTLKDGTKVIDPLVYSEHDNPDWQPDVARPPFTPTQDKIRLDWSDEVEDAASAQKAELIKKPVKDRDATADEAFTDVSITAEEVMEQQEVIEGEKLMSEREWTSRGKYPTRMRRNCAPAPAEVKQKWCQCRKCRKWRRVSGRMCQRLEFLHIRGELDCSEVGYACDVPQEDMLDHRRITRGARGDSFRPKAESELPAVDAETGERIPDEEVQLAGIHWLQCSLCSKWRIVSLEDRDRLMTEFEGRDLRCKDMGARCVEPQDPRVNDPIISESGDRVTRAPRPGAKKPDGIIFREGGRPVRIVRPVGLVRRAECEQSDVSDSDDDSELFTTHGRGEWLARCAMPAFADEAARVGYPLSPTGHVVHVYHSAQACSTLVNKSVREGDVPFVYVTAAHDTLIKPHDHAVISTGATVAMTRESDAGINNVAFHLTIDDTLRQSGVSTPLISTSVPTSHRQELRIPVANNSNQQVMIKAGDRIAKITNGLGSPNAIVAHDCKQAFLDRVGDNSVESGERTEPCTIIHGNPKVHWAETKPGIWVCTSPTPLRNPVLPFDENAPCASDLQERSVVCFAGNDNDNMDLSWGRVDTYPAQLPWQPSVTVFMAHDVDASWDDAITLGKHRAAQLLSADEYSLFAASRDISRWGKAIQKDDIADARAHSVWVHSRHYASAHAAALKDTVTAKSNTHDFEPERTRDEVLANLDEQHLVDPSEIEADKLSSYAGMLSTSIGSDGAYALAQKMALSHLRKKDRDAAVREDKYVPTPLAASVARMKIDPQQYEDCVADTLQQLVNDSAALAQVVGGIAQAHVTKLLTTKSEKEDPRAKEARQEEVLKIVRYDTFSAPWNWDVAKRKYPNATLSGVYLITSIKNFERSAAEQKYKGRLVLMGNQITMLGTGKQTSPTGEDMGLYGSVTSLEGFRSVLSHSLINEYPCEAADLTNAYLQAEWPPNTEPHFIWGTPEFLDALPEPLYSQAQEALKNGTPLFKMQKCLYGHPLSGHIWIETLLRFLKSKGWVNVPGQPAMLRRNACLCCVYVDDICVSGPKVQLKDMWDEIQKRFPIGAQGPVDQFLGMKVARFDAQLPVFTEAGEKNKLTFLDKGPDLMQPFRCYSIDMSDYVQAILKTYDELYPEAKSGKSEHSHFRVYNKDVPLPIWEETQETTCAPSTPQRRVQKMIGMLLWLSRCARPDISYALSRLGSRVSRWDKVCDTALAHVVGYLQGSAAKEHCRLIFRVHKDDTPDDLISSLYTDSNLSAPRSQTGAHYVIESPRGSLLPIHWLSKKQSICCDSVAAAELVAAHTGIRALLMIHESVAPNAKPLIVRVDNSTVVRIARKGMSPNLDWMEARPLFIRNCFMRDLVELGVIEVAHVDTHRNLADIHTKRFSSAEFPALRRTGGLFFEAIDAKKPTATPANVKVSRKLREAVGFLARHACSACWICGTSVQGISTQCERCSTSLSAEACVSVGVTIELPTKLISDTAKLPVVATDGAAGADLFSSQTVVIPAGGKALVPTDVIVQIPSGHYGRIAPRSSLAWKHHLAVGAGVIDSDYRGPIGVVMYNHSDSDYTITQGDRAAQLILEKISEFRPMLNEVAVTQRGAGGFGSTGQ